MKKYSKDLALIVVLLILVIGVCTHYYQFSEPMIKAKVDSYVQLKDAGLWIKEHSLPGDKIISSGAPQLTYYSEKEVLSWPPNGEAMEDYIKETGAKYMVITLLEGSPDWSYSWPEKNKDKTVPVQAYLMENEQPILVIYQFI